MAKVKNYLTADERANVGVGFIANEAYERLMVSATKEEIKALKKAHEWWTKYAHLLFARVGTRQSEKLVREFNGGQVEIKRSKAYRSNDEIYLTAEHVHDLADPIIETHCRNCERTDVGFCSIRMVFVKANVETIDGAFPSEVPVTHTGKCEYKL